MSIAIIIVYDMPIGGADIMCMMRICPKNQGYPAAEPQYAVNRHFSNVTSVTVL